MLQFLVCIQPPSDSPRPPRSEPPSPLTGSSPPPLLLCPQMPAPPPTPTSRPAVVFVRSSRVVGVTLRLALSQGFTLSVDSTSHFSILLHFPSLLQVSDPSAIQRAPARLMRDPVSTLPKPRSLLGEIHGYGQTKAQLRTSLVGLVRPASAHGAGGERGGGGGGERGGVSSLSSSPHHCPLDLGFPLAAEVTKQIPTNDHFLLRPPSFYLSFKINMRCWLYHIIIFTLGK